MAEMGQWDAAVVAAWDPEAFGVDPNSLADHLGDPEQKRRVLRVLTGHFLRKGDRDMASHYALRLLGLGFLDDIQIADAQ